MKKTIITLSSEEKKALSNFPNTFALQYIWVGILAMRGFETPETLSELNIKYIHSDMYEVTTPDYSLAG